MLIRQSNWLAIALVCGTLILIGCESETEQPEPTEPAAPDTQTAEPTAPASAAQQAVQEMAALAKAGEWETFITTYYGEFHKVENDEQKQQLVDRFTNRWGEKLLPVLEQASDITPIIEEDKALFQVDGETIYLLYLGDDGRWGFHL